MPIEHLLCARHYAKSFADYVPAPALQMADGSTQRVVAQITRGLGWSRKSFQKEVLKNETKKREEAWHVPGAESCEETGPVQG